MGLSRRKRILEVAFFLVVGFPCLTFGAWLLGMLVYDVVMWGPGDDWTWLLVVAIPGVIFACLGIALTSKGILHWQSRS
jgi:hypothetical protein